MQSTRPICTDCAHWLGVKEAGWGFRCKAFPEGIPERFWRAIEEHREPTEGDHGLQYEPAPPTS